MSLEEEVCEEDDKSLSLGMPMHPQEEDNEEQNDEENDEQLENEEGKHSPSPPMDEENFQVEELRVINKDQEGQPFKIGDFTPKLTLHISNEYKNLNLGMPSHPTLQPS